MRNAANLASAEAAAKCAGLALAFVLARALHPAGYGTYAVALAFGSIFGVLAGGGIQPLTIREIARARRAERRLFWNAYWLRVAQHVAGLALAALALAFVHFDGAARAAAFLFAGATLLDGLTAQAMTLFRGRQQMGIEAKLTSAGRFANLALTLVALAIAPSVVAVAAAAALGSCVLAAIAFVTVARRIAPVAPRTRALAALWAHALPFAAGGFLVYVFFRIDVLLLRGFGVAAAAIGDYSAAYRVMEVTRVPSAVVAQGYGPAAASFRNVADKSRLLELASRAWSVTLGVALPSVLLFTLVPGTIVHIVFGKAFGAAVPLLVAMALMPLFMSINGVAIQTVNSQGFQGWATAIFGLCAVVNVGLNVALIPRLGALGAALATVATEVVQSAALLTWIIARFGLPRPQAARVALGAVIGLAAGLSVPAHWPFLRGGASLAAYAVVVFPAMLTLRRHAVV